MQASRKTGEGAGKLGKKNGKIKEKPIVDRSQTELERRLGAGKKLPETAKKKEKSMKLPKEKK